MWINITLIISSSILLIFLGYGIIPTLGYKIINKLKSNNSSEKVIYLTFDDGPDANYTDKLLDLLKKHNIKVSFFVVARFAEENTDIIERIKAEGHLIALHSLEHRDALYQTPSYTKKDFIESIKIMHKLNIDVKYFRPPWGNTNLSTWKCVKNCGLKLILWNVMAEDWSGSTTSQKIANKLLRRTKNGDIICLHDGRGKNEAPSRTILALEQVLPIWLSEGYRFATVNEKYE